MGDFAVRFLFRCSFSLWVISLLFDMLVMGDSRDISTGAIPTSAASPEKNPFVPSVTYVPFVVKN